MTYSTLPNRVPDQPRRFFHILQFNFIAQSHPRMSFTQTNHAFQLTRRGGDPSFGCSNVFADFSHFDIGSNEGVRGGLSELWMNVRSSVGDVRRQVFDRDRLARMTTPRRLVFNVQAH